MAGTVTPRRLDFIDIVSPLIHDDAYHGAGKRWEGTEYTCTACRLLKRIVVELIGVRDGIGRMAVAAAEARGAVEAFVAASGD